MPEIGAKTHDRDKDPSIEPDEKKLVLVELALPVCLHPLSDIDDSQIERDRGRIERPRSFCLKGPWRLLPGPFPFERNTPI